MISHDEIMNINLANSDIFRTVIRLSCRSRLDDNNATESGGVGVSSCVPHWLLSLEQL